VTAAEPSPVAGPSPQPVDRLETLGRLTADQIEAVNALVVEAADSDGVPPLSEHVMLHLRYGGDEATHNLLLWRDSVLAAYAHLDLTDLVEGPSAEMVVRPSLRRHGLGRALITAVLEQSAGTLRLWAHGGLPDALEMATRLGFRQTRVLWQLRRSLLAPLPKVGLAAGVTIRPFEPGRDDEEWLAVNGLSFAGHPEQGGWTLDDLHQRMKEQWFDPAGFLLAEHAGSMAGFCWTKVHGGAHSHHGQADHRARGDVAAATHAEHEHREAGHDAHGHDDPGDEDHGHEPIGEIYVIGVHPKAQGMGLGRQLTVAGLRYLRARGLHQVMLYVDESNTSAIGLYESLGFSRWDVDVLFRHG
jgi:mycothiol synthase